MIAANNTARKMSEDALLAALAAENAEHPLATPEGFQKLRSENFAKEDAKRQADFPAYCEEIEKRLPDSAL